jgi:hypothetical protein
LVGTTLSIDLSAYAPLASPALTGNPTAPTPTAGDNDTSIATTAFVVTKAANYLPLAGGTLAGNLTISSAGALVLQSTTASTSPTTGALTVAGGLGVGGNINVGGYISTLQNVAGNAGFYLENPNAAGNATASIRFRNNAGVLAYVFLGSSNYSSYGGINSLNIMQEADAPIAFLTNSLQRGYVAGSGSLVWGTPTSGADGGPGSINAQNIYDDGSLLTCFGTQHAKHGRVDLAQWDALSPTGKNELAHRFVEMLTDFDPRDPRQYVTKMLSDEALPGMPRPDQWTHGERSLGEMHNRLWLAVELLASAFAGALDRIEALEQRQRG